MADGAELIVSDAPSIIKKLTKHLEMECQNCVELTLELNNIITELKTAIKIVEMLKEESSIADALYDANMSTG
jgi:hypothetical protein